MATTAAQLATCASEWRCLDASDRTRASVSRAFESILRMVGPVQTGGQTHAVAEAHPAHLDRGVGRQPRPQRREQLGPALGEGHQAQRARVDLLGVAARDGVEGGAQEIVIQAGEEGHAPIVAKGGG